MSGSTKKPAGKWFGDWCVEPNGDIVCYKKDGVGEYYEDYYILKNQLDEGWETHMGKKRWVNMADFLKALNYAKNNAASGGE